MMKVVEQNDCLELEDFIFSIHSEIEMSYDMIQLQKCIERACGLPYGTFISNVDYDTKASGTAIKAFLDVSIPVIKPNIHHLIYNVI